MFSLLTIWGLRVASLSALTDSWLEEPFDDTYSNDISFVTAPGVGDGDYLFEKEGNTDSLAFVVPGSDEGLNMNENGDISSCENFNSADDSIQGEFLNLISHCDFRSVTLFAENNTIAKKNSLFDSSSYRLGRRHMYQRQQSLVFGFFAWRSLLELRIPCEISRFERR